MPAAHAAHSSTHAGAATRPLAPVKPRAEARVQSSEWPAAPHHIPIHRGNPGDLHTGSRGERPFCVRRLRAYRPGRMVGTAVSG
ncbi:MAPK regulated corepressor interacting protein 2 [Phyllostomus discolor]|uniref:MAPK regulated corepressor interacting protein 2 n=1 Tax=Phyllostomus discolor TaxID=89673 RepID=A0A834B8X8_9CHIR|nr:MAPK regulated corepressor interacting protein 2 [Phyllostomus discolor]